MPANAARRFPASSTTRTARIRPASQHSAGARVAVTTGTRGACSTTASTTSRASPRSSAPVATTRSARASAPSGSRSGPAGSNRPLPQGRERLDGHLDGGRLARAPHGEVADGPDAAGQRARLQHAAPVEPFARAEETAVAAAGDREHSRRSRGEALLPAADEALSRIHARASGYRYRPTRSSASRTAPCPEAPAANPAPPSFSRRSGPARSRRSSPGAPVAPRTP